MLYVVLCWVQCASCDVMYSWVWLFGVRMGEIWKTFGTKKYNRCGDVHRVEVMITYVVLFRGRILGRYTLSGLFV